MINNTKCFRYFLIKFFIILRFNIFNLNIPWKIVHFPSELLQILKKIIEEIFLINKHLCWNTGFYLMIGFLLKWACFTETYRYGVVKNAYRFSVFQNKCSKNMYWFSVWKLHLIFPANYDWKFEKNFCQSA